MTEKTALPPDAAASPLALVAEVFEQSIACYQSGRLEDAEALCRAILDVDAGYAGANHLLGQLSLQRGLTDRALPYFVSACEADPATGPYWLGVADCLLRLQRHDEAVQVLETAIQAGLDDPQAQVMLAQARAERGAEALPHAALPAQEARETYLAELRKLAKRHEPPLARGKRAKGGDPLPALVKLWQARNLRGLETAAKQALARDAGQGKVWDLLGIACLQLGDNDAALIALSRASELLPQDAEVWDHLGIAQRQAKLLEAAERSFERSVALQPARPETWMNLGNLQVDQSRHEAAVISFQRTLELQPDCVEVLVNLSTAQKRLGQLDAAVASCRRALAFKPDLAEAHCNLGNALCDLGQVDAAIAHFEESLRLNPSLAATHARLGSILTTLGQVDAGAAALRRSLQLRPNDAITYSNLLFAVSHNESMSSEAVFAEHRAFGDYFEAPFRGRWPAHPNRHDPRRRLRIGFVSGDLRNHAVANFIGPVWAAMDRGQFEIWAYSNHQKEDATTERLKALAQQWRNVLEMSDQVLAERILEDEIDILFDLSGHTAWHRLTTFARKPAPIQVSWIGSPNTTGLTAMDYFLTDRFVAPPGLIDALYTEKLVRLPCGATFQPSDYAPGVSPLPALSSSVFTFASFNRTNKLGRGVIELWSRVLRAVPNSRMLLAGVGDGCDQADEHAGVKSELIARFAEHGIAANRLAFYPRTGMSAYLALHGMVDVILDTFPYGGGTTSCHALWMGVPVLTLAGRTLTSRLGVTLNSQLGLTDFICETKEAFVAQAVRSSQNLPELALLRAGLRERFFASHLGRPDLLARSLELALRAMWVRWCEGGSTESFEVEG